MSPLRWTLLILGVVFVGALVLWERLRPHQARGGEARARATEEPAIGGLTGEAAAPADAPPAAEPWIADEPLAAALPPEEPWGAHAPSEPLADLPTLLIDEPHESSAPSALPVYDSSASTDEWEQLEEGVGAVRVIDAAAPAADSAAGPEPARVESDSPDPTATPAEPPLHVQWPPESERHIVALRLVALEERFSGRTLRLALAAEGFRLGRFDIFHKPDESGRAVVSAASLTRPGTFDPTAMDSQRYVGVNLFTVLPGPMPALQAFEVLLATADNLNERLQGEVQDERGEALTGERIALLRAGLPDGAGGALS